MPTLQSRRGKRTPYVNPTRLMSFQTRKVQVLERIYRFLGRLSGFGILLSFPPSPSTALTKKSWLGEHVPLR